MPQSITFSLQSFQFHCKNDLTLSVVLRWPELEMLTDSSRPLDRWTVARAKFLVKSGFPLFFSPVSSIDPRRLATRQISEAIEHARLDILFLPPCAGLPLEKGASEKSAEKSVATSASPVRGSKDTKEFPAQRKSVFPPEGSAVYSSLIAAAWRKPVSVSFDYLFWPIQDFWIVAVPQLKIELQVKSLPEMAEKVEERIRRVLSIRLESAPDLEQLLKFRQVQSTRLVPLTVTAEMPTMPENVRRVQGRAAKTETVEQWEEIGVIFFEGSEKIPQSYALEPYLQRLNAILSDAEPSPVLLVGESGVGKTALWHEYVRRILQSRATSKSSRSHPDPPDGFSDRDDDPSSVYKFGETDATLLVSSATDPDLYTASDWQERCDRLVQLAAQEQVVLHFGNLWNLTQVGMWIGQPRSIAAELIPAATGRFPFICECTPQQLAVLEQEHPGLLFSFVKIEMGEPDEENAVEIYRRVAEASYPGVFETSALRRIDSLHRRYATYSAIPGRPLVFLHNLGLSSTEQVSAREGRTTITEADVVAAFSRETGLPLLLLDDAVPLHVEETLDWFHRRIIGQDTASAEAGPGAVSLLVETLLTYKARLSRPDRPIASLLFVGPTGVGKTETAKALAEFLYSDPNRMIRIDMSEYAEYGAAERLIRGNVNGEGLLTRKIRQQPFSVVLLDEFEKAHEEVFDLLLQVLGEGRLTDAGGRVADFRNCVVLMTSNIGVERFGLPKAGFETNAIVSPPPSIVPASVASAAAAALSPDEPRSTDRSVEYFTNEISRLLRPEMLNRIDRIVPFRPLSKKSLRKILDLQIGKLGERHGISGRSLTLHIDEAVYDFLVDRGYDPRFGARPLRRILEQELLVSLAGALENRPAPAPTGVPVSLDVRCSLDGDRIRTEIVSKQGDLGTTERQQSDLRLQCDLRMQCDQLAALRRKARILDEHAAAEAMKGRIHRAGRLRQKIERKRAKGHETFLSPEDERFLDRVAKVDKPSVQRLARLKERIDRLEEAVFLELFGDGPETTRCSPGESVPASKDRDTYPALLEEYRNQVGEIYRTENECRDRILLILYSHSVEVRNVVLSLYEHCCDLFGFRATCYALETWSGPGQFRAIDDGDRLFFQSSDADLLERLYNGTESSVPDNLKRYSKNLQVVCARLMDPPDSRSAPTHPSQAFLLEIFGDQADLLFADEFGKHRFIVGKSGRRPFECSIEISLDSLERFFPQTDASGNLRINDSRIRRTVDLSGGDSKHPPPDAIYDAFSLQQALRERLAEKIESWFNEYD